MIVSLFSGAGGLDEGFRRAGFRIGLANDINIDACLSYRRNIGDEIMCGPVELLELPSAIEVEGVIGGPPCQGFSNAGKMDPADPRSKHVGNFMAVVERLDPRFFVMENVSNLASARFALVLDSLIARAASAGYRTALWILSAAHYDVPQSRTRMFLVGTRGVLPSSPRGKGSTISVRQALEGLPRVGEPGNDGLCRAKITLAKKPVLRPSPFAGMLFNGQGRPLDLERPALTLPASMGGNRTPIIDQDVLDWPEREPWVVGYHDSLMRRGSEPQSGDAPPRLRRITVQEAAALQTFPRKWVFEGKQSSQFAQIGNAVPIRLAEAVASQIALGL